MSELLKTWLGLGGRRWAGARAKVWGEEGSSLIELALVLPVFFLFIFGLINFCLVMFGICNLSFATRAASRYACLHSQTSTLPTTAAAITGVISPFVYPYPSNTFTNSIVYGGSGGNAVGNTATVSVSITYRIVLPLYTINALTMTSQASGVIVQ